MSADNLVLVVLRGENARHRVVSVAHISLAAAIIFTPLSPRARSPPHESPRTRRVHFTLPSRTITTPPQSASTVARAPSRAHRDRAETPNRSVRSPGPSTPSRPPHRATTASPRHRARRRRRRRRTHPQLRHDAVRGASRRGGRRRARRESHRPDGRALGPAAQMVRVWPKVRVRPRPIVSPDERTHGAPARPETARLVASPRSVPRCAQRRGAPHHHRRPHHQPSVCARHCVLCEIELCTWIFKVQSLSPVSGVKWSPARRPSPEHWKQAGILSGCYRWKEG